MRDANGNSLFDKALCHVKVGTEWLQGRVVEIKEGGTIVGMAKGGVPVISAAKVKIVCEVEANANPKDPLFNDIVLLVDPKPKTEGLVIEGKTN